ncbi:MAG: spermidine/putrescine ABC transporter permease [Verrucomicrobia bacterium A1]|nr:MAG: spermidine/putrescine ABC transporter permease [Verrucomicrobia bacterium A1]
MTRGETRTLLTGLAFTSPWILGFLIFTLYPVGASIYYSFCDYDVLSKPVWIGALNYQDMWNDAVFWKSLRNTFYYAIVALPLGMVFSLMVAVLLNNKVAGRPVFRTFFFLPSLVPAVAIAMLWLWIFNGKYGLLNYALSFLHIKGPNWLSDQNWTMPAIIITSLWGIGGTVVIYLAALQDVSRELYESAEIDGASAWTKLVHITIPMISPVIFFNLIMGIIGALQVFAGPYIMFGGGGPNRSALFYAVYIYQNAFEFNQMGYACAMAWILFLIILSLTWLATRATRKHVYYAGE